MHTFLFKDWTWIAKGKYFDDKNNEYITEGESSFSRDEEKIYNDGYMKIIDEENIELKNSYELDLFKEGETVSRFKSFNPSMGKLEGEVIIKDESIHSYYISEDKIYNGFETVERINDEEYSVKGYFFANGIKISFWELLLKKK